MSKEVIDSIPDLYGDKIDVIAIDGLVTLGLPAGVSAVALTAEGQERFAKAYLAACWKAAQHREAEAERRAEAHAGRRDGHGEADGG